MKVQKGLLLCLSIVAVSATTATVLFSYKHIGFSKSTASMYTLTIDENNRLDGGNVLTGGGTTIHFDEYGANENVDNGLIELAAYGSISLQTYINGITEVRVWANEGGEFNLTAGATPNSCEYVWNAATTYSELLLRSAFETSLFYFSVHNRLDTPLTLTKIEIDYTCEADDTALKNAIDNALMGSIDISFDFHNFEPYNPYKSDHVIDPSKIPANRALVPTMSEDEYPVAPGRYTFGWSVYDTDSHGNKRKLLFTKTSHFTIRGGGIMPPDEYKVVTFHIPDNNGKERLIYQRFTDRDYNFNNLPEDCKKYMWDSPYNSFSYMGDNHFYPVFNVTGISANKDGDGCNPVSVRYSYLEKGFSMPKPTMEPGYRFGGWYLDQACTDAFDENKMYPGNLTLYAKCIETDLDMKCVYYHYEDGTLSDQIDYLYSDDTLVTLPDSRELFSYSRVIVPMRWSIYCGTNFMGLYKETQTALSNEGDKIKYSDFDEYDGDLHVYVTEVTEQTESGYTYDLIREDQEGNNIYLHTRMASSYNSENDYPLHSVFVKNDGGNFDYHNPITVERTGQFFYTDEKNAYLYDGGTLTSIASYGYGNIEMNKPLYGILRHEGVRKVGRRAFFNRFGLKGTYFPKNAQEFDIEAYANVTFNGVLALPHNLTKIGDRCFLGAQNMQYVCLPKTLKSVAENAFAYGIYDYENRIFTNIVGRKASVNSPINFLYEGSKEEFERLDSVTKAAIQDNASSITYNYSYSTFYGRGY